jgi:hypothetical protein
MLSDLNHFEWGLLLYRLAKSDHTPKPKAQMIAFPQSQLQKGDQAISVSNQLPIGQIGILQKN